MAMPRPAPRVAPATRATCPVRLAPPGDVVEVMPGNYFTNIHKATEVGWAHDRTTPLRQRRSHLRGDGRRGHRVRAGPADAGRGRRAGRAVGAGAGPAVRL